MKILITQAKRSNDIETLKEQIGSIECDLVLFPEGYISNEELLVECQQLSRLHTKPIVSSYLENQKNKDHAVVINQCGEIVLQRRKSLLEGPLLEPSKAIVNDIKIGYMLCCEIFLENIDFSDVDIIFNPIGVGMFSEEQFSEWSSRAQKLAIQNNCIFIGASHSDGSYQNCGVSIPISFIYDNKGYELYRSKNDTRSIVFDLKTKQVKYY